MDDIRGATLSGGIWKLRDVLQGGAGYELVRWPRLLGPEAYDVVVGWGHKATAASARRLAKRHEKPYVAIEDGWVRSLQPGPRELPRSLILDHSGIYYDAATPSDLERLITASAGATDGETILRAERGMARLRNEAVSKYNHAPRRDATALGLTQRGPRPRVLVVDQTYGDASVAGGGADESTFVRMLAAAKAEHPGAEILLKLHPEVMSGAKRGYLAGRTRELDGARIIAQAVNPWSLIELVDHVYVVSSQLGFEALMAGVRVSCFGAPFYAGWCLTDDRVAIPRRTARPTLAEIFAAAYFDYALYVDVGTGQRISLEAAVDQIVRDRRRAATAQTSGRTNVPSWSGMGWRSLRSTETPRT